MLEMPPFEEVSEKHGWEVRPPRSLSRRDPVSSSGRGTSPRGEKAAVEAPLKDHVRFTQKGDRRHLFLYDGCINKRNAEEEERCPLASPCSLSACCFVSL